MWAPSLRYFSGLRRKSTTSASSSFASSMPATSANVTCSVVGSYFFAFELPNENMLLLPDRRMIQNQSPKNRSVGRKPASSVCQNGVPGGAFAVITTPFSWSNVSSAFVSAKSGTRVANSVVAFTLLAPAG